MSDEQQPDKPDPTNEKLRLEIEELKIKIENEKKSKVWDNYVKPIIPVAVTLTIGIWGSILTSNYNTSQLENTKRKNISDLEVAKTQLEIAQKQLDIAKEKNKTDKELSQIQLDISERKNRSDKTTALTQLEIAKQKNESDRTIAQVNASLSYVKLLQEISDSNPDLTHQAKTVIAPALPPEVSFNIAVNELSSNPEVLEILIRTYDDASWKYLAPYTEYMPSRYFCNSIPDSKSTLFDFLDRRLLLKRYYDYLISFNYKSLRRVNSLINFFDFIAQKEERNTPSHNISDVSAAEYGIESMLNQTTDNSLKADLSSAAALALRGGKFEGLAARYFWEKYDVSSGRSPAQNSLDECIYKSIVSSSGEILSTSLFKKLLRVNYSKLNLDQIGKICHAYCEWTPYGSNDPFKSYLKPEHSFQIISKILNTLNSPTKRKEFAGHLGSLSGDILFKNISQDKVYGKRYAEILISWYSTNWKPDWYIPKFMSDVIVIYPELKPKMERKWGIWLD